MSRQPFGFGSQASARFPSTTTSVGIVSILKRWTSACSASASTRRILKVS
jgi:hypothetical protein